MLHTPDPNTSLDNSTPLLREETNEHRQNTDCRKSESWDTWSKRMAKTRERRKKSCLEFP